MELVKTNIPEVLLIEPKVFKDDRGYFLELFSNERYEKSGVTGNFVQDNLSLSKKGTLRGLHFQYPKSQGKLIYASKGEIYDVAVDIRRGSPTYGKWIGTYLSEKNKRQIWVPGGFAHGFFVTSEYAVVLYKCTDYYNPDTEQSIRWNDPFIGINWPGKQILLSDKDSSAKYLQDIPGDKLPLY